jgi:AhpD family alkylhydroperoxidase
MARIPLLTDRDGLDERRLAVFDHIVASRGSLILPFQIVLHVPDVAGELADVGEAIRLQPNLSPADRELVILAVGEALRCPFIWDSHLPHAQRAGVRPEAVVALQQAGRGLGPWESSLVALVHQLTEQAAVDEELFGLLHGELGTAGFVLLVTTVGYYTMLAYAMNACQGEQRPTDQP